MPPPTDNLALRLRVLDEPFTVYQLLIGEPIPKEIREVVFQNLIDSKHGQFISITRTTEEISIVCNASSFPLTNTEPRWRCIKIRGPMDFGLTGIMCDFTTPLKHAEIPIFALSTWNTDYILVPIDKFDRAVDVLKEDGWIFES